MVPRRQKSFCLKLRKSLRGFFNFLRSLFNLSPKVSFKAVVNLADEVIGFQVQDSTGGRLQSLFVSEIGRVGVRSSRRGFFRLSAVQEIPDENGVVVRAEVKNKQLSVIL
jgi:hypothetical protein